MELMSISQKRFGLSVASCHGTSKESQKNIFGQAPKYRSSRLATSTSSCTSEAAI
jgi:hypothetical protein